MTLFKLGESFLKMIFQITILPIYNLIEFLFSILYAKTTLQIPFIILFISVIVNICLLPLYSKAEKIQKEQKEKEEKLSKKIKSIKKNFKGDEKFMLLMTYYKQNNYHPLMKLKTSLSLLLQIPFFVGAYLFFSQLELLNGVSFGFIKDLSIPDNAFIVAGFKINVLPILMTIINIISAIIYTKTNKIKDNIQIWITPLIFLVLLYNSPSGLVLYWTFNNIFSLIKNIITNKISYKNFSLILISILAFVCILAFKGLFHNLIITIAIICALFYGANQISSKAKDFKTLSLFFIIMLNFVILLAMVIPTNIIATMPTDFIFNSNPLKLFIPSIVQLFGLFVFWGGILYYFSNQNERKKLTIILSVFFIWSLLNLHFIPLDNAIFSNSLELTSGELNQSFSLIKFILFGFVSTLFSYFIYTKNQIKFLKSLFFIFITTFGVLFLFNISKINKEINTIDNTKSDKIISVNVFKNKPYNFSKNSKNVLIIFLDRALSSYFPYILKEFPELEKSFEGFVYYPNTVSFYSNTLFAYPSVMGGYEYTPIELNKNNKLLKDKHNESLLLLPLIFKKENYNTIVTDAPYGDYQEMAPEELFKNKEIEYYNLKKDFKNISLNSSQNLIHKKKVTIKKRFNNFGLMLISAGFLRNSIYNDGNYLILSKVDNKLDSDENTVADYLHLDNLHNLTKFNSTKNSLIIINNELPHNPTYLNKPNYTLGYNPNGEDSIDANTMSNKLYHVNAASLLLVGKYLDYLKENKIYDNTRIIIVSDHGARKISTPHFNDFQNKYSLLYNPLLLVKDFNSKKQLKTDNSFMTNADVPILALNNLIKNPINPFTNKEINNKEKQKGAYISPSQTWQKEKFIKKTKFLNDFSKILHVNYDIFDEKNWKTNILFKDIKTLD